MSNKTKKLLILNLPYFIAGLICTNLGEAWKMCIRDRLLHRAFPGGGDCAYHLQSGCNQR